MAEKTIIPYLFDFMARYEAPRVFVDDNAPAHSSRVASKVFHRFGVNRKYWPPNSPDHYSIENIWAWINWKIWKERKIFNSKEELQAKIEEIWDEITPKHCRDLIFHYLKDAKR